MKNAFERQCLGRTDYVRPYLIHVLSPATPSGNDAAEDRLLTNGSSSLVEVAAVLSVDGSRPLSVYRKH